MGFFDAADHRPPTSRIEVGETVTGTITHLSIETNLRGRPTLTYSLDNGMRRWANRRLWAAMAAAGADLGSPVTITRLPDDPSDGQGMAGTNWQVTAATTQATAAPQPVQQYGTPPAAAPAPAPRTTSLPDW